MMGRLEHRQDQGKAIRGDGVLRLLEDRDGRAALVRDIRLHYHLAMSEPARRLSSSMPQVSRARNARRIMSNDIPERMTAEEQPYCICHPDMATEDTYRSIASSLPTCAIRSAELDLLPEVSIAEEARESKTDGGKLIYDEIMSFKYRYAIMGGFKRTVELIDHACPAYLNGKTEVRWRLTSRQGIACRFNDDLLPCIEEDIHLSLEDQDLDERHGTLADDEAKLLYNPLPRDLPTVKKTFVDTDDRPRRRHRTLCPARQLWKDINATRPRLYHPWFLTSHYVFPIRYVWDFQRAIMARRIMLNDASVYEEGWPSGVPMPYIIWWPLQPQPDMLGLLAMKVSEMKRRCVAAAIVCDYENVYKSLDPELALMEGRQ
ncbi:hypothetical protein FCOIX_1678 [Fusarium coicis]|nr:hypothetical protein FCOIX_1678 [Fusarium coicis]